MQRLGLGRSPTNRVPSGSGSNKTGFLDKAKAGMAHTSLLPGVVGNSDLRLLQTLIIEEKAVNRSSDKLAQDTLKSSASLKAWGDEEGVDLSDVCAQAELMLNLLSKAFERYAERTMDIRAVYKSVRTREEDLDEMKKKRRSVGSRGDSAQKKLEKMTSENKNLQSQTTLLQNLRDEARELDTEILNEEARLSDWKRLSTKHALGIKFGSLLELAEKATIVGELGKLLIEEIPLDTTPPGHGRAPYHSFEKTARLAHEAEKCVDEVIFNPPALELGPGPSTPSPMAGQSAHGQTTTTSLTPYNDHTNDPYQAPQIRGDDLSSLPSSPMGIQTGGPSSFGNIVLGANGQELPDKPALTPAAAYRQSYTASLDPEPTPVRDDGYGNPIPPGEAPEDQIEPLPPVRPVPPRSTSRPKVGGPRLSLGLGPAVGGGDLGTKVSDYSNPVSRVEDAINPVHGDQVQQPSDEGPSILPYVATAPPALTTPDYGRQQPSSYRRPSEQSLDPRPQDSHDLQPPSAPFAQPTMMPGQTPLSEDERESYVDAPEIPRPSSAANGGSHLDHRDYVSPYQRAASPGTSYGQPLPRPPQLVSDVAPTSNAIPISSSTAATSLGSSPASPHLPQGDHQFAAAAAQREVEREMDSLAFTSATSSGNASQPITSDVGGPKKISAGAFFKRGNAQGARFVPPAGNVADGGLSDDEDGMSSTRPLNVRKSNGGRKSEEDSAPPYVG